MFYSHKLSRTAGCSLGTETFPPLADSEDRQFYYCGLHQQARGTEVPPVTHTGTQTDSLEQFAPAVTEGHSHVGHSELWGRSVIQGQPTVCGLETSP